MRTYELKLRSRSLELGVEFEANVTPVDDESWYLRERWQLTRNADVRSRPPEAVRALACPSCGAPFRAADEQRCEHCGQIVGDGRFDWYLVRTSLVASERTPPALGGYAPEHGTRLPTRTSASVAADIRRLRIDDPEFDLTATLRRIAQTYARLNQAWTSRDLALARPWLSEGLFDYLRYWVEAYRRQGLINRLDDMQIRNIELVELARDRWYDALTVRVHATGLDYTVRESDEQLLGGSRTQPRAYSEYWTLIRGAGVRGAARADENCPNCGAPLQVNMAGNCEHCSAHLTRGEFDWVLSKIEQDESYQG